MSDFVKRDLGTRSHMAREALEGAIWGRGVETMRRAEGMYANGELTPEKAFGLLVSLLEQKRLRDQLEGQIDEGLRASERIAKRENVAVLRVEKEAHGVQHGRNRFFERSKVPPRKQPV